MTIDMSQFLETFYEESFEGLDVMESELLNLNVGAADSETINTIFRAAHSIKGGSGTFGLSAVADFTHVMETLLDEMRDGTREVTQPAVNILLNSVDVLREMLTALRTDQALDGERIAEAQQQLDTLLAAKQGTAVANPAEMPADQGETDSEAVGWKIKFKPYSNMLQTGNDPVRMFRELAQLGELQTKADIAELPTIENITPEDSYLAWELSLTGKIEKSAIEEVFDWVEGDCDLEIIPLASPIASAPSLQQQVSTQATPPQVNANGPAAKAAARKPTSSSESSSIRVAIEKIDDLINMMGELVITQSMLSQLGEADEFQQSHIEKLRDGLAQLERNTREMQENVMRIRMLPISFAFQRFPRLVHDLSGKLNKKIELKMSGEQTELDKTVMEKIGDPLVHLVRNSLDHGIEAPEVRKANGKPETGEIHLNAFHEGGNIVIEISDDGAGLNKPKILQKAKANGVISDEDALTDEQICDLIFSPGFSTADVVSDVSGRGVGMDVVRKNIRALGGTVDVRTEDGQGSTFTIRLPLTLAILDGQSVRVGEEIYILPLISIVESIQVKPEFIQSVAGRADVYRLRDDYIPIVKLYQAFDAEPDSENLEDGLLVVVEGEGQKIALFVDDLLGQQQVVIKSLETNFKKVEGISGATILGDGTVALILDITGLIHLSKERKYKKPKLAVDNSTEAA